MPRVFIIPHQEEEQLFSEAIALANESQVIFDFIQSRQRKTIEVPYYLRNQIFVRFLNILKCVSRG